MLLIFSSLVIGIVCLTCAGNTLLALMRWEPENPFLSFWLGFFFMTLFGLALSLFLPLEHYIARFLIVVVILIGIPYTIKNFQRALSGVSPIRILLFSVPLLLALFAVTLGLAHDWAGQGYDTDLYHAQIVRWLKEYGSPPGLGNLHARLAQTSLWLTLAAQIEIGLLHGRSAFLLPGLWMMGGLLYFYYAACRSVYRLVRLYALCLLLFLCWQIRDLFILPGLYYDRPALLLYLIACAEILPLFLSQSTRKDLRGYLSVVFVLVAASFLTKALAIPALFAAMLLLAWFQWGTRKLLLRDSLMILLLPALAALLWLIRNSLVAGWPFFPLAVFQLPVDWAMPADSVHDVSRAVWGWARLPGPDYLLSLEKGISFWFGPWLERHLANSVFWRTALYPLILGGLFWVMALRKPGLKAGKYFFFTWSLLNLVYWFCSAPSLRFGWEFFWAWLALGLAFALNASKKILSSRLLSIAALLLVAAGSTDSIRRQLLEPVDHVPLAPAALPQYPGVRWQDLHAGSTDAFRLYYPPGGDDRCGNAPLPCADALRSNLCLRRPPRMAQGFHPCAPLYNE